MATYYIAVNGSDANSGTLASPFASLAAAQSVVLPGDTVYFRAGTYQNATFGDGNVWKAGLDVVLRVHDFHGTAAAPITIAAAPGEHVVLEFDGNGGIRVSNSEHVRISGFEIKGPSGDITMSEALAYQFAYKLPGDATVYHRDPAATLATSIADLGGTKPNYFNSNGVMVVGSSNHIEVSSNIIHDVPGYGISALNGADYLTIRGNTLYNNSWWAGGTHAISVQNATSSDAYDGYKIVIEGNTLFDNYSRMISWALSKTAPVSMVNDEGKGIHLQDNATASGFTHGEILVAGNLVIRSGNAGITENNSERITIVDNNLADNGYVTTLVALGLADPKLPAGYSVEDGGMRLQSGGDLRLYGNAIAQPAGSNAIDASSTLSAATVDVHDNVFAGGVATNPSASSLAAGLVRLDLVQFGTADGDSLVGGSGNDYLDAWSGSDRVDGGAGNDIIVYDASDDLGYVLGGAGTDTLKVVDQAAPASFTLGAHGFEYAQVVTNDRGNAWWSRITDYYNGDWQRMTRVTIADDARMVLTTFDITAGGTGINWVQISDYRDAGGTLTHQDGVFDDGSTFAKTFDFAIGTSIDGVADWLREYSYFFRDIEDQKIGRVRNVEGFADDGRKFTQTNDIDADQPWIFETNWYKTDGVTLDFREIHFDNGTTSIVPY